MNRKERMLVALERIAKFIPSGEFLLASDSCAFMETVYLCIEEWTSEIKSIREKDKKDNLAL